MDDNKIFPTYNSFAQSWQDPSIESLYSCMQQAMNETQSEKEYRQSLQKQRILEYSVDKIAELLSNL
jgi:hypothetical protein